MKISSSCDPSISKALVEVFTIMKQPRNAIKELKEILDEKHDDNIVNLICDLQIQLQEFSSCIDLLENLQKDSIPLEIEVKKGYCLARLGRLAEADICFEKLMKHSVRYYDDLFLLVGSLYMDLDQHENSLRFFEPLLALPQHNKPNLWFKCGKLYYDIKDFKSAEEAFKSVVETFEPGLVTQAKLYLSKIYKSKGEIDKSILILKTKNLDLEDTCEISDEAIQNLMSNARLKIEESFIKKDQNELLAFMDSLIDTEFKLELRKREDIVVELGVRVLNEVFEKLINFCIGTNQYSAAKNFLVKILKLNMYKGNLRMNMKKLLSKVCVLDKDYEQALNAFKFVCENEESESNWIVMSSLMRKTEKPQLRSWLCKIAAKSPENYAAHILLGNSYFQTGNYNLAIKQYMQVYSVKDSVVNLQLGLSHLFSLCSRNLVKKEEVFAKAFRYMKIYVKARKNSSYLEAYYNLARAYHHIQFYAKASYNYEKVLRHCARALIYGDGLGKSLVKYSKLAAKNLVAIRNTIDDPAGAEDITQQWLCEIP